MTKNKIITLDGEWSFASMDKDEVNGIGVVPGSVYLDLIKAGFLADPFVGENESLCAWIADTEWVYRKNFELSPDELQASSICLAASGIDTLAKVYLNGKLLGETNNMFREWRWEIGEYLTKSKTQQLEIRFLPLKEAVERWSQVCPLNAVGVGTFRLPGAQWLRKAAYQFGWDWGPKLPDIGIYKSIQIEVLNTQRFSDVRIDQIHQTDGTVSLKPKLSFNNQDLSKKHQLVWCLISPEGEEVSGSIEADKACLDQWAITIEDPKLWWPRAMGAQCLYEIKLKIVDDVGSINDLWCRRIGLRSIELDTSMDGDGHRFSFVVNGKPVFIKGANWIPADSFLNRITKNRYEDLLNSAVLANMNMIRVWGGGIYEADDFYDFCDEEGLLVWQDFMYACSAYPSQNDEWMENAEVEAREQLRRLRHHPCIALYCGNNELEQFPQIYSPEPVEGGMTLALYDRLFKDCLSKVVKEEHSEIPYWVSSPHSLHCSDATDPKGGDVHVWTVWWGMKPFNHYRMIKPRFCSEFGFQSLPHPQTIGPVLESDDQRLEGAAMAFRQRGATDLGPGNATLLEYMKRHLVPTDHAQTQLWFTQVLQGMALEMACDAWMTQWPYCQGLVYWQLNDCWPGPSWSTVDYHGIWKVAHYVIRRMYQPTVLLWDQAVSRNGVISDKVSLSYCSTMRRTTELSWVLEGRNKLGEIICRNEGDLNFDDGSKEGGMISLMMVGVPKNKGDFLIAKLYEGENEICSRVFIEDQSAYCFSAQSKLSSDIVSTNTLVVKNSGGPAFWVWIEGDDAKAIYSDNAFHLMPNEEKLVHRLDCSELPSNISVRSLLDKAESR